MTWKLFLDDQCRDEGMESFRYPPASETWETAVSSAEAIDLVKKRGIPSYISFDHDLGGEDNAMKFLHYIRVHYLEAGVDVKCPGYDVHSQNPQGRKNIEAFMTSWAKVFGSRE